MDNLPIESSHPVFLALAEIQKPRSRFQLEKFVIGQHETPEQQYKQTLLEIQQIIYTVKNVQLEIKKVKIEIDKLRKTGDEVDEIDAQIKELGLEQTHLALIGAQRELKDLMEIWESFDYKYTYEEIEQSQPLYWDQRLVRQSVLEQIGGSQAQAAHLDALRQIGALSVSRDGIKPSELVANKKREIK